MKTTLLSLITVVLGVGLASAETKAKPATAHIASPAEKRLDGIPRRTDKDDNLLEPFHIARTPAEKVLDDIFRRADKDKNIFHYVLGTPWYDAKKDTGYSRLFTKKFARAATKKETDLVKKDCGGKYLEGELCGIDYSPITCGQDYSESGYLYRTVEDDGHKAKILSLGVDFIPSEIKTSHRLIKDGDNWKLDGVNCDGGEFNMDCSNSVCAKDVPYFREKAEAGDSDAQFSLGVMYSLSRGVKGDYAEAAAWFRKAAEQGHAYAQSYLGYLYEHGRGVTGDETEAAVWYRKAAEQGHADAQYKLGYMYSLGRVVRLDEAESARWFLKAAEQGQVQAQSFLGPIYEDGRGVAQDYAEAAKWFRKAAELGSVYAQYKLGMMYDTGRGVKQDHAEATSWLRKAAARGYAEAQWELDKREIEKLAPR